MSQPERAALIAALRSAATHGVPMPAAIAMALQQAADQLEACSGCAYCYSIRQGAQGATG